MIIDPQKYMERQLRKDWMKDCVSIIKENCFTDNPTKIETFEEWISQQGLLQDD